MNKLGAAYQRPAEDLQIREFERILYLKKSRELPKSTPRLK